MTSQEKAKAGLWLLKQAVLEYLAKQPNGAARPDDIRDALDLHDEDAKGENKGRLLWGLGHLLKKDGKIRADRIDGDSQIVLVKKATRER
jgi:hypothetical protein